MKQYKNISLLILDEWLLVPLTNNEARDLPEIIEARNKRTSTIFSSQLSPAGWHGKKGEGTLADANIQIVYFIKFLLKLLMRWLEIKGSF